LPYIEHPLVIGSSDSASFIRIFQRISNADPEALYERLKGRKAAGTNGWLVNHNSFETWLSGETNSQRRLWLSGKGMNRSTHFRLLHC
jgi:hypothetical protein